MHRSLCILCAFTSTMLYLQIIHFRNVNINSRQIVFVNIRFSPFNNCYLENIVYDFLTRDVFKP